MPRLRFTRAQRLSGRRAFAAVFDARVRKNAGPVTVFVRPNGLTHSRLGLSVGRRVGNAVARNRLKRLLREAFRLDQHDLPEGYDLVIVPRPHPTLTLPDYRRLLHTAAHAAARQWHKRTPPEPSAQSRPAPPDSSA